MTRPDDDEPQLELPGLARARDTARAAKQQAATRTKQAAPVDPAPVLPVARVLVDVPLAHLDQPFDYLVPRKLDAAVVPGSRVKVRFAGQDVDGFVVERVAESDHPGRLTPLRRVVCAGAGAVARGRPAGPSGRRPVRRHAAPTCSGSRCRRGTPRWRRSRARPPAARRARRRRRGRGLGAVRRRGGRSAALAAGGSPRAVWSALPGADWPRLLATPRRPPLASGRGALLVRARPPRRGPGRRGADRRPRRRPARDAHRRRSARRRATARSWPCPAGPCRWWSAPGPPCSPRCATSGWWRSGTTATTCTPSRGRRTRTPARCCSPGRSEESARPWSAASPAPSRAQYLVRDRLGRASWSPLRARPCARSRPRSRSPAPRPRAASATRAPQRPAPAHGVRRDPRAALAHGPVLVQVPRAGYLSPAWPATGAGPRPAAGPAPARCTCPRRPSRRVPLVRPAASRSGPARSAAAAGCAPRWWARGAPPRSSAARSRRCRCAPPAATTCSPPCTPGRPWWSPPPAPSRSPRAATPRRCCSTPGLLLAAPRPARRRGGAAPLARRRRPGAPGRRRRPGGRGRRPRRPDPCRRWSGGTRSGSPSASWPSGSRRTSRRPSRMATVTGAGPTSRRPPLPLVLPEGAEVLGPVPADDDAVRLVVRVPRASGPALSRALVEMQGVRDAKKLPAPAGAGRPGGPRLTRRLRRLGADIRRRPEEH